MPGCWETEGGPATLVPYGRCLGSSGVPRAARPLSRGVKAVIQLLMAVPEARPGGTRQVAGHVPPWSQPNLVLPRCHAQWLTEALKERVLVPQREQPNTVVSGV